MCWTTIPPTSPPTPGVLRGLPQDTSFVQRHYLPAQLPIELLLNVVLMGTDRTSIHKPQFCLTGSGWNIDGGESAPDTLRVESPHPYDLPVMKLIDHPGSQISRPANHLARHLCLLVCGGPRSHRRPLDPHAEHGHAPVAHRRTAALGLRQLFRGLHAGARKTQLTSA